MYFAHPYSSWERGLNKNTNGLIRQYFTKGSSFESITDDGVEAVMHKLNHRPRKTLNFKTRMYYFLLGKRKKPYDYYDCTSELSQPDYLFVLLDTIAPTQSEKTMFERLLRFFTME